MPAILDAEIVGVVSSLPDGNVYRLARQLGVRFECLRGTNTATDYQTLRDEFKADHVTLSGHLQKAKGLDPRHTTNIHPGPLAGFGGPGKYGHHVHEAVRQAYLEGLITQSEVCMHFVTDRFDDPRTKFFGLPVALPMPIDTSITADQIGAMVNQKERALQAMVLNEVLKGRITLDVSGSEEEPEYRVRLHGMFPTCFCEGGSQ
jgi:phosphoribosylglycinamide formyltransferase-1